jgi:O-methyltransferase involved in polyketide biosynthesis
MSLARYSSPELIAIRDLTSNRLPPATAVHGMAMYELQRGAEQERLFHSTMFDLSELKHMSAAQAARTDSLERAVKACASHHDNDGPVSLAAGKHVNVNS